jgi:hypothetical protein
VFFIDFLHVLWYNTCIQQTTLVVFFYPPPRAGVFLPKGLNMNKLSNNILNLMRKKKTESNIFVACPIGKNMVMVGQIVQIDIDFLLSDLS